MVPLNKLGPDLNGKAVNETQYRGMIGSLMYLTASRTDIQFLTCLYARYHENPKESRLIVVKRISRYLKGTPNLGLQYPKRSGFDLKGYSDSNCDGCNMDRKNTSAEAKDVVAAGCCANILWIKSQLTDYDIIYEKIKNHTLKKDIEFHFIPTEYQIADIFIKLLDKPYFKRLINELAVSRMNSQSLFNAERVPQSTKPGAKYGHKKHSTSLKQPPVSSKEATKYGSSKAPTGSKTGHLKRKKESNSAMDSNPSQTSASIPVVAEMHKEDQQLTGGPTSLGVTNEARANPPISSGVSDDVLVKMDDPRITMEEYIRLEEEKDHRRDKVYNLKTARYGKIWDNEDVYYLRSVGTEFSAIVFNYTLTSEATLLCEPMVSIRRMMWNGYGVSTSCTALGPRETNFDEYWWRIYKSQDHEVLESLYFKAAFQHEFLLINSTWRIYQANIKRVSHSNSL
nr:hypothetical protein [Tanacetum cinerariifolium]